MPGTLYHLAFAEEVYRHLQQSGRSLDKSLFMSGNLIPDFTKDKKNSHYRIPGSIKGFEVPNLSEAKRDLYRLDDPILLGMYCHLYLDYHFIEDFLIPEFTWDEEHDWVINPRNQMKWTSLDFFSDKGLYGAYTEINCLLLRDNHVSMDTVKIIPEDLPKTGLPVFDDDRSGKSWKKELDGFLADKRDYTGNVFCYDRIWNAIMQIANDFVDKELN